MAWVESLDLLLFRFCNQTLRNPVFDLWMPWLSWNSAFPVLVLVLAGLLLWQGGRRGRLFVLFVILAVAIGDGLVCNTLKQALGRVRPCNALADVHLLVGASSSGSLPSAHATNWFAATLVCLWFYRRWVALVLPIAALVSFSRIYNGVHYPGDVLLGAVIGAGTAAAVLGLGETLWQWAGRRAFPLWHARLPSLLHPDAPPEVSATPSDPALAETHWLRLGYVLIALLLGFRLWYVGSGTIELSEDEAYQWLWSKHLALSYYSKPPLIAYTQWLGTSLWGDTEFGVRFFSPVLAAGLALMLLRFFAREGQARVGFWLVPIATATPMLAVGATLMTIDPLSVFFWTAAMLSGWRAVRDDSTRHWLTTGMWMGLGLLSKYTGLVQFISWACFFLLWRPARAQLRRPGPWWALLLTGLCTLPVLVWNAQHGWITLTHLKERGDLDQAWHPTLRFLGEFLGSELGLLNPVFFVAAAWAAVAFWRRPPRDPLRIYLFSMGAPLFLFYLLFTLRARVLPNWIAPAVVPLFGLMALYWQDHLRAGRTCIRRALVAGLVLGGMAFVVLHDTNLIGKVAGSPLPPRIDPLHRVRGWKEMAALVGAARTRLLAEGKPVILIGGHYGVAGLLSFYVPEAKAAVPRDPIAFYVTADRPENQFFFWPGYAGRKGCNAIFVQTTREPRPPPPRLLREFASVTDLGVHTSLYRGRPFHAVQLFECRDLQ
jgi:4-amino-4-deoxy-L-arabinose transferase-like glycosyltransferase/membrane-associated phospholipid phosphatase